MSQPEFSPTQQPQKASLFKIAKAIGWSLLGVRKMQSYESDIASITPVQAVIAALVGLALFIASILTLVTLATKHLA
jgi:hypothetical protein